MKTKNEPCPSCGAIAAREIVYGLPGPELMEAEQRGEVILGGCIVWPDAPTRRCSRCGFEFGRLEDEMLT